MKTKNTRLIHEYRKIILEAYMFIAEWYPDFTIEPTVLGELRRQDLVNDHFDEEYWKGEISKMQKTAKKKIDATFPWAKDIIYTTKVKTGATSEQ